MSEDCDRLSYRHTHDRDGTCVPLGESRSMPVEDVKRILSPPPISCVGCGGELNCAFQVKIGGTWESYCGDCWLQLKPEYRLVWKP